MKCSVLAAIGNYLKISRSHKLSAYARACTKMRHYWWPSPTGGTYVHLLFNARKANARC